MSEKSGTRQPPASDILYHCATHGWWSARKKSGCPDCVVVMRKRIAELERELNARPQGSCPDGWKMVPVEPTDAMLALMTRPNYSFRRRYEGMLKAAPPSPAQSGWMPIESAPHRHELLVFRKDAGVFIAKFVAPDDVMSDEEIDKHEFPDDFEAWWSDAYGWQEGAEIPTHYMPLPQPPQGE